MQDLQTFKELSNILNVSEMTVRRDVKNLENEHLVNRKYKGIELNKDNNSISTSILNTDVNFYIIMVMMSTLRLSKNSKNYFL